MIRFVLAVALVLLPALPAWAAGRVALVIGNGAYTAVPSLVNPINDAEDISDALANLGFQVFTETDATRAEQVGLLTAFAEAVIDAEVALFYYAGHAFQVGGENYLVPTDLQPGSAEDIVRQTVPLDAVVAAMERTDGLKLIFLDACRDNPLGLSGAGQIEEGLADVGLGADTFISYATQPGAVAFDGDGRNGTFTQAVLSHIHTPAQSITDFMINVRRDVISASGGAQIPWENSSLTRQFTFREGVANATPETLLYQVAARTGDRNLMALYVDRYPEGAHSRDVARFLQGDGVTAERSLTEADPDGDQLWLLVQRTRMRRLAEYYLELYPQGLHREAAESMVNALPTELELGDGRLCEELATHPRDATANTAGVPFSRLARNAGQAIEVCSNAVRQFPALPHYGALLARAKAAGGQRDEAIALYREAAEKGDVRALVSLGLITETGDGVARDPVKALEYYQQAADLGSADGAINLAVALFNGGVVPANPTRAVALFRQASDAGSAIATYNLGVLAQDGALGEEAKGEALALFRRAAEMGEPRGFVAAAIVLDEGRGLDRDAGRAADMLLRGAAADDGEVLAQLTQNAQEWSPDTIRAVQSRLKDAGYYQGALDGIAGGQFNRALDIWRNGGFNASVLSS